jgi:acyl transferase domain-containing protein
MWTGHTEEDQGIGALLASEAVGRALLKERNPEQLALYWTKGGDVPWEALYEGGRPRLIRLPTYPFARERHWLAERADGSRSEDVAEPARAPQTPPTTPGDRALAFLVHFLSQELHLTADQLSLHRDMRHYGADSITAMRLIRAVEQEFRAHLTGRDLLEHRTLHTLSSYLAARIDEPPATRASDVSPYRGLGAALRPPPLPGEDLSEGCPNSRGPSETLARSSEENGSVSPPPAALDALDRFKQGSLTLEEVEALLTQGETL